MASPRPLDRSRALRIGLWLLFVALVIAGGDLVLRACGIWPVLGFVRNYCPASLNRGFARDVAEGESLRRQVHVAELRLAEQPPCPPPTSLAPTPVAPPAAAPAPPTARVPSPESKAIDKRVEQRGGKKGQLQFTLAWNTLDDLDLNVTCPGGQISSISGERGPGICGEGVKDIDANRNLVENVSSTPVENVVWPANFPAGNYGLEVIEYKAASRDGAGNTVPFTLRMRFGDEEQECRGEVTQLAREEMVERNGITLGGTEQFITWHTGGPLPQCDFTERKTVRSHESKK